MMKHYEHNASRFLFEVLGLKSVLLERYGEIKKFPLWLTFAPENSVAIEGVREEVTALSIARFYEAYKETLPFFEKKEIEYKSFDWFSEDGDKKGVVHISESFFSSEVCSEINFIEEKYFLDLLYLPYEKKLIAKNGNEEFFVQFLNQSISHIKGIKMEKYNLSVYLGSLEVSLEEMQQIRSGGKITLDPEMIHEIEIKLGNITIATGKTPSVKEIEVSEIKSSFIKQLL